MATKRLLMTALSLLASHGYALQPLSDEVLSGVTGQAQGLRLTTEFALKTPAVIEYIDDNGIGVDENGNARLDANGNVRTPKGSLAITVDSYTKANSPLSLDIKIDDVGGRKALVISADALPVAMDATVAINSQSLGAFGQSDFVMDAGDRVEARIYAGGNQGNGTRLDLELPKSLTFDTYYEDEGARYTTTISLRDKKNPNTGGLSLKGLTVDIEGDGLRLGLPTIKNGTFNMLNSRLGNDVIGSTFLRNINLPTGGYLLLKNAKDSGDVGLEMDALVPAGTSFDLSMVVGEVGDNYPNNITSEQAASIKLLDDLMIKGARTNVDGERGVVFDFDRNNSESGVKTRMMVDNLTIQRSDIAAINTNPVGLGTLDVRLNLTNKSYLQVQGH